MTYHKIVTFHGTRSLVILILFCTCTCLSTYFAIISSFCTNFEVLLMICDTIERLVTIFTSHFYYKVCTRELLNDEICPLWFLPVSWYHLPHFLACHILTQIENSVYHFQFMVHLNLNTFIFTLICY